MDRGDCHDLAGGVGVRYVPCAPRGAGLPRYRALQRERHAWAFACATPVQDLALLGGLHRAGGARSDPTTAVWYAVRVFARVPHRQLRGNSIPQHYGGRSRSDPDTTIETGKLFPALGPVPRTSRSKTPIKHSHNTLCTSSSPRKNTVVLHSSRVHLFTSLTLQPSSPTTS